MSNLENIISQIKEDSIKESEKILNEAKSQVEEMKLTAVNEANDEKKKMLEKAKTEAEKIRERTVQSNELKVRDNILFAKQAVLDDIYKEAEIALSNIAPEEFASFLKDKVSKLQLSGDEKIIVPKKYANSDFGLNMVVEGSDDISSGFLLESEKSTLNFSFEDLLDSMRTDSEKDVLNLIFEK